MGVGLTDERADGAVNIPAMRIVVGWTTACA